MLVRLGMPGKERIGNATLAILTDVAGKRHAARLIGPAAGAICSDEIWGLVGLVRIDAAGQPLSSMVDQSGDVAIEGHDWGALGLPDGLDTRVVPGDRPASMDERELAGTSAGHRIGEAAWWRTIAPGDAVVVGDVTATLVTVDRRRRLAEIEHHGETVSIGLDELTPGEST